MKILIHTCCAPCLTYPKKWLEANGFDITSFYYNPNIYPEAEFVKRYFVLKGYAKTEGVPLIFEFDNKKTNPGDCNNCYEIRLRKTAEYAKNNGFRFFSTTLLISPYQNHDALRKWGMEIGRQIGIEFVYHDFREGFRESREISRQFDLYRQKYCGCKKSRAEQYSARTGIKRKNKNDQIAAVAA